MVDNKSVSGAISNKKKLAAGKSANVGKSTSIKMKEGGVVKSKHSDAAEDRKLISKVLKEKGLKCGGKVKK